MYGTTTENIRSIDVNVIDVASDTVYCDGGRHNREGLLLSLVYWTSFIV
jgi:hypothetical protein